MYKIVNLSEHIANKLVKSINLLILYYIILYERSYKMECNKSIKIQQNETSNKNTQASLKF